MDIDEMKVGDVKKVAAMFSEHGRALDNGMIGKYVIVRCRDAGVHAGYLQAHNGRECVLTEARRLWYWKPANKQKFLSGVATDGLDASSKLGKAVERLHLTENCEIILCSDAARASISGMAADAN